MKIDLPQDLFIDVCKRIKKEQSIPLYEHIEGWQIAAKIEQLLEVYADDELFTLDDLPEYTRNRVENIAQNSSKSKSNRRALRSRLKADADLIEVLKAKLIERDNLIESLKQQQQ
ncbi:hypothetical protein P3594_08440 [Vibrio parahaemolyticus]|uniref:hypothetical protein n=1 Tax=Vibrio harveyi group TaxID=717610 RepID=UPI00111E6219|nr:MULTISPECIES: hypothetical protein [Vibrio harveyi group]EIV8506864.1 hypothetical protein [Vibrio parahaemolyticus]ELA9813208.1 hypothetical protein [Vibrio parahaemolyticus]ELA9876682.1 hypothetical protein [Vibrio parahaemolyticus]ELA9888373.1 hypothetical protein [Vibrio parahaemolyticus]MBO0163141.1 hypothetical protein [Vibrio alginolyticus]